jgi:hypothetical protein
LTRFRIFALLAVLTAMASVFAACGGSSDSGSSDEDPQKVIENAGLEGVKSGNLDLSLHVKSEGKEPGDVEVEISGPFEAGAKGELPQFEMSAEASGSAKGEDLDFEVGLTVLTDRAFIDYKGKAYEIDPSSFGFIKSALESSLQQEGSESADITACQKAAEGIKFSQFAEELVNEGSADVDGTSTTKVSGDVDVSGGVDALIQLTEDPACSSQLKAAGPLPLDELEETKGELSKAVKNAHIDLYVGDDDIVRKFAVELTVQPPEAGDEKVELELEMTLSGVNEKQSFSAPSNAKSVEDLITDAGIDRREAGKLIEGFLEDGIGGVLEGLGGDSVIPSFGGGGSSGGGAAREEYKECLQGAETSAELQKCANLLK